MNPNTLEPMRSIIEDLINRANAGRRVRRTSWADVQACIRQARNSKEGLGYDRWTVANSYGYRATTAAVVAVSLGDRIALHIGSCDAFKNSSSTTWATGLACNRVQQEAYFHITGPNPNKLISPKTPDLWLTIEQSFAIAPDRDSSHA